MNIYFLQAFLFFFNWCSVLYPVGIPHHKHMLNFLLLWNIISPTGIKITALLSKPGSIKTKRTRASYSWFGLLQLFNPKRERGQFHNHCVWGGGREVGHFKNAFFKILFQTLRFKYSKTDLHFDHNSSLSSFLETKIRSVGFLENNSLKGYFGIFGTAFTWSNNLLDWFFRHLW